MGIFCPAVIIIEVGGTRELQFKYLSKAIHITGCHKNVDFKICINFENPITNELVDLYSPFF